jgi:hypothetical protein
MEWIASMTPAPAPARVNCLRCQHHYISWDPNFPYGCRQLGFKSRRMPCLEVLAASGQPCNYYSPRTPRSADDKTD